MVVKTGNIGGLFQKVEEIGKEVVKLAHIGNSSWLPFDVKQPNLDVFHIETSSEPSKDFLILVIGAVSALLSSTILWKIHCSEKSTYHPINVGQVF